MQILDRILNALDPPTVSDPFTVPFGTKASTDDAITYFIRSDSLGYDRSYILACVCGEFSLEPSERQLHSHVCNGSYFKRELILEGFNSGFGAKKKK